MSEVRKPRTVRLMRRATPGCTTWSGGGRWRWLASCQPLNKRLSVGLRPANPRLNSRKFCYRSVRDLLDQEETTEKRMSKLKSDSGQSCDSGISVWNSKESL